MQELGSLESASSQKGRWKEDSTDDSMGESRDENRKMNAANGYS